MVEYCVRAVIGMTTSARDGVRKRPTVWFIIKRDGRENWVEYNARKRRYYIGAPVVCVWPAVAELCATVSTKGRVQWVCSRPVDTEACARLARDILDVESISHGEAFVHLLVRPLWNLRRRKTVSGAAFLNSSPYGTCI